MSGLKKVDQQVTSFQTKLGTSIYLGLADSNGLVILGWWDSDKYTPLPTTASIFSPGCIMINQGGTSTTTNVYINSGTTASPTWTALTIN